MFIEFLLLMAEELKFNEVWITKKEERPNLRGYINTCPILTNARQILNFNFDSVLTQNSTWSCLLKIGMHEMTLIFFISKDILWKEMCARWELENLQHVVFLCVQYSPQTFDSTSNAHFQRRENIHPHLEQELLAKLRYGEKGFNLVTYSMCKRFYHWY